jgi:hypothetical protein
LQFVEQTTPDCLPTCYSNVSEPKFKSDKNLYAFNKQIIPVKDLVKNGVEVIPWVETVYDILILQNHNVS